MDPIVKYDCFFRLQLHNQFSKKIEFNKRKCLQESSTASTCLLSQPSVHWVCSFEVLCRRSLKYMGWLHLLLS